MFLDKMGTNEKSMVLYDELMGVNYDIPEQGKIVPNRITLGRKLANDICVPDREAFRLIGTPDLENLALSISGTHCALVREDQGLRILDNCSTNGTYHNNVRVLPDGTHEGYGDNAYLKPGDKLKLGKYELEVRI